MAPQSPRNVSSAQQECPGAGWRARHLTALLLGNLALALGPWWVRLADSGPVSAGFWRLALALPMLILLARVSGQPLRGFSAPVWWGMIAAGAFFGLDLASWHIGIEQTRLGNAALFGNSGSLIVVVWGMFALRRRPRGGEWLAFAAAIAGAAILMGRSLQIDPASLRGDLLCLLAGLFYAVYILILQGARSTLGNWSLLVWSSLAGAPVLLALGLLLGEPVWPHHWTPLLVLAFTSQIAGQGLLVFAMRHFTPLVIGLALMTQPAIAAMAGWLAFGEMLSLWDAIGMVLVAAALVLASAGERPASPAS